VVSAAGVEGLGAAVELQPSGSIPRTTLKRRVGDENLKDRGIGIYW
jgi:hypothetical protein